jgi:hypothetical protein
LENRQRRKVLADGAASKLRKGRIDPFDAGGKRGSVDE